MIYPQPPFTALRDVKEIADLSWHQPRACEESEFADEKAIAILSRAFLVDDFCNRYPTQHSRD